MSNKDLYQHLFEQLQPRADRNKLESPLEEMFIQGLEKYLSDKAEIYPQYEVTTLSGTFRLDFLITVGDKRIGFECDGKDFHDEWRDALILGSDNVDAIYRFRGKDIHTFLNDCIYLVYHYDRELFSNRYLTIANQLASEQLKNQISNLRNVERNAIGYDMLDEDGEKIGYMLLVVERRDKSDTAGHWNVLFDVAKRHPGLKIEQLMEVRKKERRQF